MVRGHRAQVLTVLVVALTSCGGSRGSSGPSTTPPPWEDDAGPRSAEPDAEAGAQDRRSEPPSGPPPPGAQSIRNLAFDEVNCTNDTPLDRLLRLDFPIARGWSCQVTATRFADLTGDRVEEAIVSLEFRMAVVERLTNGTSSERRVNSNEFVVLSLRGSEPELLAHLESGQGDLRAVEVAGSDLRVELVGCWDCGCDELVEFWTWDGYRFAADEDRTEVVYEAPECDTN